MAGTATATQGANAQSQQPAAESPEIVAARAKANETGYARNRAEAIYNAAKKEHGADSAEAKAAKKTLEAAQAEVEQAQAELKAALKLPVKKAASPAKPAEPKAPAKPIPEEPKPTPALDQATKSFYIERRGEVLIRAPRTQIYEIIQFIPAKDRAEFKKRLEKLLKEIESRPKNLEYYQKVIKRNNGELLKVLEVPQGELLKTQATRLQKH